MKKRKIRPLPAVTFRTVTICFSARTVDVDGRTYQVPSESDCFAFPIISGDVVVMPREPWRVP